MYNNIKNNIHFSFLKIQIFIYNENLEQRQQKKQRDIWNFNFKE